MKNKTSIFSKAVVLSILLALITVGVALAVTIVVDGDEEAVWTTGVGEDIPQFAVGENTPEILDDRDTAMAFWTHDDDNFYFLIRTYEQPAYFDEYTWIMLCIDTDNNTATGTTFSNCNNMGGIDRYIKSRAVFIDEEPYYRFDTLVYNYNRKQVLGRGTFGYNQSAANPVIEISVPMALLGLDTQSCRIGMPMVVYFDGATTDPDDTLPTFGTFDFGCGEPQWCSPGYWRQEQSLASWIPTGYEPSDLFFDVFGYIPALTKQGQRQGATTDPQELTLWYVLQSPQWYDTEAFNAIGDLLSEAHPDVNFLEGDARIDNCPMN